MYCRNCAKEVNEKAVACPGCGVPPLAEKKFCSTCGAPTAANQTMCVKCGVATNNKRLIVPKLDINIPKLNINIPKLDTNRISTLFSKSNIIIAILIFLVVGIVGAKFYLQNEVEKRIDIAISKIPQESLVTVTHGKVSIDLLGFNVHIQDVVLSPVIGATAPFKFKEVIIYDYDRDHDIPYFYSVALNGMEVNTSEIISDPEARDDLSELGYEKILFNLTLKSSYDPAGAKKILNHDITVEAGHLGKLKMSIGFNNIDLDPKEIAKNYLRIALNHVELSFTDDSLVNRVFDVIAKRSNISVNDVKNKFLSRMESEIVGSDNEMDKLIMSEIKNFIDSQGTFTISVKPTEPLPLLMFMQPYMHVQSRDAKNMWESLINLVKKLNIQINGKTLGAEKIMEDAMLQYYAREKVSMALLAASSSRTAVAESYANDGKFSPWTKEAMAGTHEISKYLSGVHWDYYDENHGAIVVTLSTDADLLSAANKTIILSAVGNPSTGAVTFECQSGTVPRKSLLPETCRNSATTAARAQATPTQVAPTGLREEEDEENADNVPDQTAPTTVSVTTQTSAQAASTSAPVLTEVPTQTAPTSAPVVQANAAVQKIIDDAKQCMTDKKYDCAIAKAETALSLDANNAQATQIINEAKKAQEKAFQNSDWNAQ